MTPDSEPVVPADGVSGRRKAVEPLAVVAAVLSAAGLAAVVACGYGFTRPEQPVTVERATALVGHWHRQAWAGAS